MPVSSLKEIEQRKLELEILELKILNEFTSLQQYIKGFITGTGLALGIVGILLRSFKEYHDVN